MKKNVRLYILLFCVICFFAVAPFLVAYSMGYRFDIEGRKIVGTGGIYVRTFPAAEQVLIDSKIAAKPGIFSGAIFVQSLLPKNHTVLVQKTGYYDYQKTISVQEKTVTKLENITLFKKSVAFSPVAEFPIAKTEKILDIKWAGDSSAALVKTQNSKNIFYYLFTPPSEFVRLPYLDKNSQTIFFNPGDPQEIFYLENQNIYSLKNSKVQTIIKGALSYAFLENSIVWLSSDGGLYESDISGNLVRAILAKNTQIHEDKKYELKVVSGKIFLQENDLLYLFDQNTRSFENFGAPEGNYKIFEAPDGKNLVLWSDKKIYLYSFENQRFAELFSGQSLKNCQWLNNDYIIFTSGNEVIISEIDYRGNINTVTLPGAFDNPQIFYVRQSGKIYVLIGNTLSISEKLTP